MPRTFSRSLLSSSLLAAVILIAKPPRTNADDDPVAFRNIEIKRLEKK